MRTVYTLYITPVSKYAGEQFMNIRLDAHDDNRLESRNEFPISEYNQRTNGEQYM